MPDPTRMQAVAETRAFAEDIDAMLSPDEREAVIAGIARDPAGGDLIPGLVACASGASLFRGAASAAAHG